MHVPLIPYLSGRLELVNFEKASTLYFIIICFRFSLFWKLTYLAQTAFLNTVQNLGQAQPSRIGWEPFGIRLDIYVKKKKKQLSAF